MSKRHGWLSPDVVDGHETTCISLYIPDDMAHRAAFWGAITELARDHNWDTNGDDEKAAALATYWRHLIFEGLTEDCSMAGVVDVRLNGQALEKTFDGETWEQFATIQQITSAVAETLEPGENATISLVDGILTVGIPRGAAGAAGATGAPGTNGASVELRVNDGWVQWRQSDDSPSWTDLFEIPEGGSGGGEPFTPETKTIFVPEQIYRATLGAPAKFDIVIGENDFDHFTVNYKLRGVNATTAAHLQTFFNNDTVLSGNNYFSERVGGAGNAVHPGALADAISAIIVAASAPANDYSRGAMTILYADDATKKGAQTVVGGRYSSTALWMGAFAMVWNGADPITRLSFSSDGQDFEAGSEIQILGWKNVEVVTDLDGGGLFKGDTGEPGADGTDGTDGREIEMQAVQDENGTCQAIQWRYQGDSEWLTLVTTPVCEEAPTPPQNLQMNRCGVAAALTNELERLYIRVKEDPTLWDTLEGLAAQAESGGQAVVILTGVVSWVVGAPIIASAAAFGGALAAGGAFLRWVFGANNSGVNEWTSATTEHLTSALYCVLTRRETITITADVLREWMSYAADAPVNGDNDTLVSLIGLIPVSYWSNEAAVAQPDINSCLDPCTTRTGQWCTEIGSLGGDTLTFDDPIVRATSNILIGRVEWDTPFHLEAVPTPLDTLLYSITLNFGRDVILGGLDIGFTYLQSVDTISPAVIVTDNLGRSMGQTDVSGITGPFGADGLHRWRAAETTQVRSITITGKVAVADAEALTNEMLRIDYIRLCGDGYAPYGEAGNNCEGCDPYDPCIDGPDYGTEHCYTWDFRASDGGWTPVDSPALGEWVAGVGWRHTTAQGGVTGQDTLRITKAAVNAAGRTVRRVEVELTMDAGFREDNAPAFRFWTAIASSSATLIETSEDITGVLIYAPEEGGAEFRQAINLFAPVAIRTGLGAPLPDPRGSITVRRVSIWYNGQDAEFTGGTGS